MNITYLLGAGASAQKLPTVKEFAKHVTWLSERIRNQQFSNVRQTHSPHSAIPLTEHQLFMSFLDGMKELAETIHKHPSFDTYARILYLTNEQIKLRRLKSQLDLFLSTWQVINGVDQRYDLFFASILEGGLGNPLVLPSNIKILSWNYDFQPELSIRRLFNLGTLDQAQDHLGVFTDHSKLSVNKFSLIKLNGASGGYLNEHLKHNSHNFFIQKVGQEINDTDLRSLLIQVSSFYYWLNNIQSPMHSSIAYAWENNTFSDGIRQAAKSQSAKTDILVVIGYSFPTFNRKIDRMILNGMPQLQKIYIQDKSENLKGIETRVKALLGSLSGKQIELIDSIDEFHIPFEFG